MIRVLPILYVVTAVASALFVVAGIVSAIVKPLRKWRFRFLLASMFAIFAYSLCLIALGHLVQTLEPKINALPANASPADVLQVLGSPTKKYEPAHGAKQVPIPNSAVWHYEIDVYPFKQHYRLEFIEWKLVK